MAATAQKQYVAAAYGLQPKRTSWNDMTDFRLTSSLFGQPWTSVKIRGARGGKSEEPAKPISATLLLIITSHIDDSACGCYLGSVEPTVGDLSWTRSQNQNLVLRSVPTFKGILSSWLQSLFREQPDSILVLSDLTAMKDFILFLFFWSRRTLLFRKSALAPTISALNGGSSGTVFAF